MLESLAIGILVAIIFVFIIYVMVNELDILSIFFALGTTVLIILANPIAIVKLDTCQCIQYYTIVILATVVFAFEFYKKNKNLLLTLVLAVGTSLIALYVGKPIFIYLSIFFNLYLVARMINILAGLEIEPFSS